MVVFHSDLDNTLIYSRRRPLKGEKVCVERYQGREVSFMTTYALSKLEQASGGCLFVPTTTRTVEQYRRIRLGLPEPEYALVCNGGVLLRRGVPDLAWYQESLRRIQGAQGEIQRGISLLEEDPDVCFEVRYIDRLFVFTKSGNPDRTVQKLREVLDLSRLEVARNHQKVYLVPRELDKGAALLRLRERLEADLVLAAGDSSFDVGMLRKADLGFAPGELRERISGEGQVEFLEGERPFSDLLMDRLRSFV